MGRCGSVFHASGFASARFWKAEKGPSMIFSQALAPAATTAPATTSTSFLFATRSPTQSLFEPTRQPTFALEPTRTSSGLVLIPGLTPLPVTTVKEPAPVPPPGLLPPPALLTPPSAVPPPDALPAAEVEETLAIETELLPEPERLPVLVKPKLSTAAKVAIGVGIATAALSVAGLIFSLRR